MSSSLVTLDRLRGLSQPQIMSAGSNVQFQLVREAGTFNCEGWFKDGKGSGHFVFSPSAAFSAELVRRGYPAPTEAQQFSLAMEDARIALLDELNAQGYDRPSLEGFVRMAQHGVTIDYAREMKSLGYMVKSTEMLTRMVDHGVTTEAIKDLDALGFK